MTEKRKRLNAVEKAERIAKIVKMRDLRMTWDAIGKEFGISGPGACKIYKQALANHPISSLAIDEHRTEELGLVDLATRSLLALALSTETTQASKDSPPKPVVTPRTKVEAWSAIRGWSEHKAKLLGLNAPVQAEMSLPALEQMVRLTEIEMGLAPGQEIPDSDEG